MTVATPAADASVAEPTFHLAPVILDEPDDSDRREPSSSAALAPHSVTVDPAFAQLSTRRLTAQVLEQVRDTGMAPDGTALAPMAATTAVVTYTPAQIRAAYGLPALASTTSSVTSAQAAQQGAGQTIYLIDAYSDPNVAAELASFDAKFGLPGCTPLAISTSAALPLAAAPTTGCTLSIVYSTMLGAVTTTAPAYNSGWAMEIALDVQWAHATAPFARIILIEAPDNSMTSLTSAVQLANQFGPGVVSQSFGSPESSGSSSFDAIYSAANMTYLASTGDAGAAVNWPAVSAHVLAAGGTSLVYGGTGARTETVWSGTGGGVSAYVATPAYQSLAVPGLGALTHRGVADLAFNADPNTGQYLAIITPGATSATWYSGGGTSIASPQWAGILAAANALRAQDTLAPLGASQPTLYGLGLQAASYANAFLDVTKGSDGTCTTCDAGVGYDLPTGLGTPNVASLWAALTPKAAAAAPVVTTASVSGKVGTALTFAISASDTHALTYSLTGAPAGMSVNAASGIVTWSAPVAGAYSLLAHALDAQTGLTGQATLTVSILAPQPPQVAGGPITGTAQTALLFPVSVTDTNTVTLSLSGAPAGMTVNSAGVISWAAPVAGTYAVIVTAHDPTTGLNGQGTYTVTIAPIRPPVVAPASIAGTVGKALAFNVNVTAANPLTYRITGAPRGLTIASTTGAVTWATPVLGTFAVTVIAQDTKTGLSGQGIYTLSITQGGPSVSATSLTGVAGQALTGSITISDSASNSLSLMITGVPSGMGFSVSGSALIAKWASPVTGTYAPHLTVIDGKGLTATATIPITITAH
jgi:subtilase family serine protease